MAPNQGHQKPSGGTTYMPSTEQVRLDYVMAYTDRESSQLLAERDFDRWLESVKDQARAEAVYNAATGHQTLLSLNGDKTSPYELVEELYARAARLKARAGA